MDLGFLYQVRAGQDHHSGPLKPFSSPREGTLLNLPLKGTVNLVLEPGLRKHARKNWNKHSNTTHPPGSVPQAISIHQILWGQETQAKLTKPEWGTDLGEGTFSVHVEKLKRDWRVWRATETGNEPAIGRPRLREDQGAPLLGQVCSVVAARTQAMCEAEGLLFPPLYLPCTNSYSLEKHPFWNFPQTTSLRCIWQDNWQEVAWEAEGDLGLVGFKCPEEWGWGRGELRALL